MNNNNKSFTYFSFFCLFFGVALRLIWIDDMEWKYDQKLMHSFILDFLENGHFRYIGMKSGVGLPNFGASVWGFYIFGALSKDPVMINLQIVLFNSLGLFFLLYLILRYIPQDEKEVWLIAFCSLCVSFLPISFSRHLWAQNIIPPLAFITLFCYIKRGFKKKYDFVLGFFLVFLGQIHMSGFFLGVLYFIAVIYYHLTHIRKINLYSFLLGIIIGILPGLPYIYYVFTDSSFLTKTVSNYSNFFSMRHTWYTFFQGFGLDIFYHFNNQSLDFFKFPSFYLTGMLFFSILIIAIISIIYTSKYFYKNKTTVLKYIKMPKKYHITTQFFLISYFSLILISLTNSTLFGHYFIVSYPFIFIYSSFFISKIPFKQIKYIFVFSQLLISILFLYYIHIHQGFNTCEFGKTYSSFIK